MNDRSKTKQALIQELASLRERITELEQTESGQKQAEEKFRENEGKYRTLIENIQDAIYILDSFGKFTFVNDVIVKRSGYAAEWFLSRSYLDVIIEKDREHVKKSFNDVMDGKTQIFDLSYPVKTGKLLRFETHVAPIFDGAKVIGLLGVSRDITERKQMEEALQDREEKYRTILENIQEGYFESDLSGNLTFFNDSTCLIMGYSKEELMGMNDRQYVDKENARKLFQAFNKVYNTGEPTEGLDWQIIRKDGTKIYVEVSVSLLKDSSGKPTGFRGIGRDVTKRKQAESQREAALEALRESEYKYKSLIENIPGIILTIDLKGTITFVSRRTKEILGYEDSEMINMTIFNFIPGEDHQRAVESLQKGIKGEKIKHIQIPMIAKSGEKVFFESSFTRIYKDGAVVGAQGTAIDITERKLAESQREVALEALRLSEENFRRSLEDLPLGVRIVTIEGETIYANQAILDIYGYDSMEELKTTPVENRYIPESFAEYRIRREKRKRGDDAPSEYDIDILRKDDEVRHLHVFRKDILWNGERQFQVLYRDITDRKQAEKALRESEIRYRELFENMGSGVSVYETLNNGDDFIFKEYNAAAEMIDKTPREQVIGQSVVDLFPGVKGCGLLDVFQRVYRTGKSERHPITFYKDEKISGWRENYVYKLPSGEIVAVFENITERKQAEEKIKASLREKDILLSEIHHRVKNNMQVISGLLDLPAALSGNQERRKMFHDSQSRIHAMSLVHEKLYGSKDFARIDLVAYVKTLSQDLFQTYKIHPGKIDLIIQTDGDVYVDINKAIPCGLILNELISNAIKHAFSGDRHGKLQIIIRGIKNTEIEIVVRDNGLGLPDDVDIHQPLSVGLYLVKGLVKSQLDGKMEVRRDAGTEVRIKFPL